MRTCRRGPHIGDSLIRQLMRPHFKRHLSSLVVLINPKLIIILGQRLKMSLRTWRTWTTQSSVRHFLSFEFSEQMFGSGT